MVGRRSLSPREFVEEATKVHGDTYTYERTVFRTQRGKVTITCSIHGDFEQEARRHLAGRGCPQCNVKRSLDTQSFIAKAREVHGKKYRYDKTDYVNYSTKVTITCPTHGDWQQTPNNHLHKNAYGCPSCGVDTRSSTRTLKTEEFLRKAQLIHGGKYRYHKTDYAGSHSKLTITCPTHGDFEQLATNHLSGYGCYACAGIERISNEKFIQLAKERHGESYDYSKVHCKRWNANVVFICPEHGEFTQTPASHLTSQGCRKCSGREPWDKQSFIVRAKEVHGDRYDYSELGEIEGIRNKVKVICPQHGEFFQNGQAHLLGHGCIKCSHIYADQTSFLEKAIQVHGATYGYGRVEYVNSKTDVTITCGTHGDFQQNPRTHLSGAGCPRCINKREGEIAILLNDRCIAHRQYRIEDRYFDFYLPEYGLLIERDGEQHYRDVSLFSGGDPDYLPRQQINDAYKTELAERNGYKVARIPFWLTSEEVALELDNILEGKPSFPSTPDLSQLGTLPKPRTE